MWLDQVETICDVKTLSPLDTSGSFSIADKDPKAHQQTRPEGPW